MSILLLPPSHFPTRHNNNHAACPRTRISRRRRGGCYCTSIDSSRITRTTPKKSEDVDCVVVGGGISGLCIAQALVTKHMETVPNVIVTEARERVGGNIITVERDGFLWEEGPNSFQPSDSMLTTVVDCGLKDNLVFGDPDAPRFVLWGGKLRPVPSKPTDLPFFDLMSFPGKLRAGFGALGIRPPSPGHEESVEEFVRRNLGDEVFERLIEPFCSGSEMKGEQVLVHVQKRACWGTGTSLLQVAVEVWVDMDHLWRSVVGRHAGMCGMHCSLCGLGMPYCLHHYSHGSPKCVYAGDPAKLSMKAAFGRVWNLEQSGGSIIGGAIKAIQERRGNPKPPRDPRLPKPKGQTVCSFTKGLSMLPDAISTRLGSKVKLSWKLLSVKKLDGGYTLAYETQEGLISVQAKSVIMTVPSHVASSLLRPLSAATADGLSKFYYPPVAAVSISYPKEAIRKECLIDGELRGFGQLHPRSQGVETLGTIYSSTLFPNRAPLGRVLLLNYIGGATNPGILSKTDGELVEAVDRDLRKMLINPTAKDPLALAVRVWPQAIPQFLVGHLDLLDAAKSALKNDGFEGIFLGGNYVSGVALGRCVECAYESAKEVSKFLSEQLLK
ncbi:hypothetical protein IFM89_007381 [Coptis chinensis]|uniref:Protoporphyrinogen oxidase n=1 Tax=Coptis chinensis TaxID=261450 RepID=A0A835MA91_9MAGN|nr:hypothetical protein IFM89_007381 [Coptis chinensis]